MNPHKKMCAAFPEMGSRVDGFNIRLGQTSEFALISRIDGRVFELLLLLLFSHIN